MRRERRAEQRPSPRDDVIRQRLERQGRRDTKPELALRRELHRRGVRFWVDRTPIPGIRSRADLVFPRSRLAVFVDGCFWHRCPVHGTAPKYNSEWWQAKLDANEERDRRINAQLADAGWLPVRIWEHENPTEAADSVQALVRKRQGSSQPTVPDERR